MSLNNLIFTEEERYPFIPEPFTPVSSYYLPESLNFNPKVDNQQQ
jgi:hypothetical protein